VEIVYRAFFPPSFPSLCEEKSDSRLSMLLDSVSLRVFIVVKDSWSTRPYYDEFFVRVFPTLLLRALSFPAPYSIDLNPSSYSPFIS